MLIPNDQGGDWRLKKFVEYQHLAPAVDPITLVEFAKRRDLNKDELVQLAWFHSLTYCEITATLLFDEFASRQPHLQEVEEFWKANKKDLVFGSARKYVKNMDWFVPLMEKYLEEIAPEPYKWLESIAVGDHPKDRYKAIEKYLGKWKFMGRFSVDLFTEEIITYYQANLIPLKIESAGYDWRNTSNLTSGLFNIFYMDDAANSFDKGELVITPNITAYLNKQLWTVLKAVEEAYPEQDVDRVTVTNKICSFRNLFKNARYGGFHHDRQLENLVHYQKAYGDHYLWDEWYIIRKTVFPEHMLGELNGWTGIRKERKKLWTTKGLTGVERD